MNRTILAIEFAVLVSLLLAPHTGGNLFQIDGYGHAPIFVASGHLAIKRLIVQTIVVAVLFAVMVNIPRRRQKKDDID